MKHTLKSVLAAVALLVVIAAIGVLVSQESGVTGAATSKTIACHEDQDCNDNIAETEDVCKNPSSTYCLCVNRPWK